MSDDQESIKSRSATAPKKSAFKKAGGAIKYMTFDIPKNMLGVEALKINAQYLSQQAQALKAPICPNCNQSKLKLNVEADGVRETYDNGQAQDFYHWDCSSCQHSFLLPLNNNEAKEMAIKQRNENVEAMIHEISDEDLMSYAKVHQVYSRILYLFSLISFFGFIYMLAFTQTGILPMLALMCVSVALFTNGLTKAYRYWQTINRHVFVENSFKDWFHQWNWFV